MNVVRFSPSPRSVTLSLGERSYTIEIGPGLLGAEATWAALDKIKRVAIVSNETIWPLFGERLRAQMADHGIVVTPIILPDGEEHKSWQTLNTIFDALITTGCDRHTPLIALGGGVVGDVTGFAAAVYQRGVPFVQVPTTLLAMVDSAVGGKTAINHPLAKNMIGAFHQPLLVVADTDTLQTLPRREYASGLAEVVKYGLIYDAALFDWLEANANALRERDAQCLAHAIARSCEIKAQIVAHDERETLREGGRALLNFGHTFGHAIENLLGYGEWLHGEAVACGMVLASNYCVERGMIDATAAERLRALLQCFELPVKPPRLSAADVLHVMGKDKKNSDGAIRLVLLERIGRAITAPADRATLDHFLQRAFAPNGAGL
jgi:3-dehydroquinate synthase